MKITERSSQIWSLLAFAAHNRQILTCQMVYQLTGIAISGIGKCLEPIQSYCLLHHLPPLTILVVNQTTGLPGAGFTAAADILKTQLEVFDYHWLAHGAPKIEEFEEAVLKLPSNGSQDPSDFPFSTQEILTALSKRNDLPYLLAITTFEIEAWLMSEGFAPSEANINECIKALSNSMGHPHENKHIAFTQFLPSLSWLET